MEATAGEMAGVSEAVSSVTADQVRGIQQTTTTMEAINRQVRGIADSSQPLNVSVEESSSSILELGAAGEELNETASVLSGKVERGIQLDRADGAEREASAGEHGVAVGGGGGDVGVDGRDGDVDAGGGRVGGGDGAAVEPGGGERGERADEDGADDRGDGGDPGGDGDGGAGDPEPRAAGRGRSGRSWT